MILLRELLFEQIEVMLSKQVTSQLRLKGKKKGKIVILKFLVNVLDL